MPGGGLGYTRCYAYAIHTCRVECDRSQDDEQLQQDRQPIALAEFELHDKLFLLP
jgi:hypothetical protein